MTYPHHGGEPVDPNPWYPTEPGHYGPPYAPTGYGAPPPASGPVPGYGYPPPGYFGYPPPQPPRPGQVVTAAVLGYVLAGLLVLSGVLLLLGADLADALPAGAAASGVTAELAVDGVVDLIVAGLLIGGGITVVGRSRAGRTLLVAGAAITLADAIYWMVRIAQANASPAILFLAMFMVLAGVSLGMILSRAARAWIGPVRPPGWQ
ncbi:MAG: hypothetical protein ACRDTP_07480 [Mycobacteriales bacterium]